jgi:hypothetical protein
MWLVFWPRFPRCVTTNFSLQNFAQQTVMQIVAICINSHDMIRPERIASTTVTNPNTGSLFKIEAFLFRQVLSLHY